MKIRIPVLEQSWDIAALFAPPTPDEDKVLFLSFLIEKVNEIINKRILNLNKLEQGSKIIKQVSIGGKEYRVTRILSFLGDNLTFNSSLELVFSKDAVMNPTGWSADQLARLLEYGNNKNETLKYISLIFREVKTNLKTYWTQFYEVRNE